MNQSGTRPFVIWGAKGHGKVLRSVIEQKGGAVVAFVDNDPAALAGIRDTSGILGFSGLESFLREHSATKFSAAVAIGGNRGKDRLSLLAALQALGLDVPPIVDAASIQESGATYGPGSHLLAGSILGADSAIGTGCILNHNSVVDHECHLEDGVHLAPSSTICGCVHVETGAFIGAGATVLPRLRIGAYATIAAGAVVTKDVAAGTTVLGVPAALARKQL